MIDLGKYVTEVLLAYGVSITMIIGLVWISLISSRRAKQILEDAENA